MEVRSHIAVSALLGTLVGVSFRSAAAGVACFLSGVLLDLDHIPDYFLNYGLRGNVSHFFKAFKREILKNIIVFLHAWEWMFLAAAVLWILGWPTVAVGALIGASVHLLLDHIYNRHCGPAYFLTYRLRRGFASKAFYGEKEYAERLAGRKEDQQPRKEDQ